MKRFSIFAVVILVLLLSACASEEAPVLRPQEETCPDPFSYVGVYESFHNKTRWAQLHTFDEKLEACQLPLDQIKGMSTGTLALTCINHPLAPLYLAYRNEFEIVEILFDKSNVFQELAHRDDAGRTLVSLYSRASIQPDLQKYKQRHSLTELTIGQMHFLELLLASGHFPEIFEEPLANELKKTASSQLAYRRLAPDIYSIQSKKVASLLIRELNQNGPLTFEDAGKALENIVIQESVPIRTKAAGDITGTTSIYTPRGSAVYALYREEYSSDEIAYSDNVYCTAYPNATLIESSSITYECHSYAWNMAIGGPTVWIISPTPYINDASYVTSSPINADVLYSSSADFSAIPTTTTNIVISKWPNGPVMRHNIYDSPYNVSGSLTYYRVNGSTAKSSAPVSGNINGSDLAPVGVECVYSYVPFTSVSPNGIFEWEVLNSHMEPTEYNYSTNGNQLYITFNAPGEYYLNAFYFVNNYYFAQKELLVLASYEFNSLPEPDSAEVLALTPIPE